MMRIGAVIVIALVIAGCSIYHLVGPEPVTIGSVYTVEPQIPWSAVTGEKWEVWTVDGVVLESVWFLTGLDDGEPLFGGKAEKRLKFQKTMAASEIMELVADSVSMNFWGTKVSVSNLRPEKFGEAQGFRFELAYSTRNGLEEQASVTGAVVKERLYLIMYSGAREHYYAKYKDHAERIIQSVRLK